MNERTGFFFLTALLSLVPPLKISTEKRREKRRAKKSRKKEKSYLASGFLAVIAALHL